MLRAFCIQRSLQFLVAQSRSVLIGEVVLRKGTVGNTQNKFAVAFFGVDDAIGVVPAVCL